MSARHYGRRGFSGHRPTPDQPQAIVLQFTHPNEWNVDWEDPPATDRAVIFLNDITAAPFVVASQTTAAGSGEADLIFVPVALHSYQASVRFSRDGEPGPWALSNTVAP